MVLKPQDILVLLKLLVIGENPWSYNRLALELGMSQAEVHAAVKRALLAGLAVNKDGKAVPHIRNLEEFLIHGLRYVFVAERGEINRGMPTGYSAEPLKGQTRSLQELPTVWPDPEGEIRGVGFSPLYRSAPKAARADSALYELLVLVDAIRDGQGHEQQLAIRLMRERLSGSDLSSESTAMDDRDSINIGSQLSVSSRALLALVRLYHIQRLVLFGSAARGELEPGSDIDLLVEFKPGRSPSLGGMVEIKDALSVLFGGRKVDLATPSILNNPYRRRAIEKDMEELYAA